MDVIHVSMFPSELKHHLFVVLNKTSKFDREPLCPTMFKLQT